MASSEEPTFPPGCLCHPALILTPTLATLVFRSCLSEWLSLLELDVLPGLAWPDPWPDPSPLVPPATDPPPAVSRLWSSAAASLFRFSTMLLLILAGGERGEPSDVFRLEPPELEPPEAGVWRVSGARPVSSRNGLVLENRNGFEELAENGLVAVSCWAAAGAGAGAGAGGGESGGGWSSRSVSPAVGEAPPSRSVPSPPPQGRVSGSPPCAQTHTARYSTQTYIRTRRPGPNVPHLQCVCFVTYGLSACSVLLNYPAVCNKETRR